MRITKISVKGLFGMFDHEIPLNQESRITIIHGPNGVGKTVLMQMVNGLFHYEYEYIAAIPFEQLRIGYERGNSLIVERNEGNKNLVICYVDHSGKNEEIYELNIYDDCRLIRSVEQHFPDLTLVNWDGKLYWLDQKTLRDYVDNGYFILEFTLDRKSLFEKFPDFDTIMNGRSPEWFAHAKKNLQFELLETERLRGTYLRDGETNDVIFWDDIEDKAHLSGRAPAVRYLTNFFWNHIDDAHAADDDLIILKNLKELAETETEIQRDDVGDSPMEDNPVSGRLDKLNEIRTLTEERLKHNKPYQKIELFRDIINERILFKTLEYQESPHNHDFGFRSENGTWLDAENLSSGEQHLLLLYYRLIFEIEPDTVVMIDEPELSMNVVWQRNFLKDLQRIIELRDFDVLIATHSPMVIHDKWDWVVHLGEKVDD